MSIQPSSSVGASPSWSEVAKLLRGTAQTPPKDATPAELISLLYSYFRPLSTTNKRSLASLLRHIACDHPIDYFLGFIAPWVCSRNVTFSQEEIRAYIEQERHLAIESLKRKIHSKNQRNRVKDILDFLEDLELYVEAPLKAALERLGTQVRAQSVLATDAPANGTAARELNTLLRCFESFAQHVDNHVAAKAVWFSLCYLLEYAVCKHWIEFDNLAHVRQAYWTSVRPEKPRRHYAHRTIRINAMPFAEAAVLYRMECLADRHGINLEQIEVDWKDVSGALVTNRIDIAFYSDAIVDQFRRLKHVMDGRIAFESGIAMSYHGYYVVTAKQGKGSANHEATVAVVSNSDHEHILKANLPTLHKISRFKRLRMVPVSNPDEAVALMVNGRVTACVAGAIHYNYLVSTGLEDALAGPRTRKFDLTGTTKLRFYAAVRTHKEMEDILGPIAAVWNDFVDEWPRLSKGLKYTQEQARDHCVAYVNRAPPMAFVNNWDELDALIDDHNRFDPIDATFEKCNLTPPSRIK